MSERLVRTRDDLSRILTRAAGRLPLTRRLDWVRARTTAPDRIGEVLNAFAEMTAPDDVTFVQVGSNDGTTSDPLRHLADSYGWAGILVEPVPYVFERLKVARGGNPRLTLANLAVAEHDGEAEFFYLAQDPAAMLPEWYDQLGSFSIETLRSHAEWIPGLEDRLVVARVPCRTFESLCRENGVSSLDLIHVDAEGYDWEIVRTIDLGAYRPTILLYEHCHLAAPDREACRSLMSSHDYVLLEDHNDTLCVARSALVEERMSAAWNGVHAGEHRSR